MPPSTILHLDNIVAVLRRSPASVTSSSPSSHHRADETLPRSSTGSWVCVTSSGWTCAELGCAVRSVLDQSNREDVRLHQPRCANTSAFGLWGYVDNTLPSRCYASPWSCVCVGFFWNYYVPQHFKGWGTWFPKVSWLCVEGWIQLDVGFASFGWDIMLPLYPQHLIA